MRQPRVPRYANYRPRSEESSRVGVSNRRQNTAPELLLRKALWSAGIRYRLHVKHLPGCPDLVIAAARVAIFCDGDFWHGRHWRRRKEKLEAGWNAEYWVRKIASNRRRDRLVTRQLRQLGWRVVRVWESDVRGNSELVASRILKIL